jgi:type IV pilus assembly protein PilA
MLRKLQKDEKGFTLVELMIVVVILGILVAIAVPIFNKVTGDAEKRAAQANARTIESVLVQIQAATGVPITAMQISTAGVLSGGSLSSPYNGASLANPSASATQYFKTWPQYSGTGMDVINGEVYVTHPSAGHITVTSIP